MKEDRQYTRVANGYITTRDGKNTFTIRYGSKYGTKGSLFIGKIYFPADLNAVGKRCRIKIEYVDEDEHEKE